MTVVAEAWLRKGARLRERATGEIVEVLFRKTYPASDVRPRTGAWTLVAYVRDNGACSIGHAVDVLDRFERVTSEKDTPPA